MANPADKPNVDDRSLFRRWKDSFGPTLGSGGFYFRASLVLLLWGVVPVVVVGIFALLWLASYDFRGTPAADVDESIRGALKAWTWQSWTIAALALSTLSLALRAAFLGWKAERDAADAKTKREQTEKDLGAATKSASDAAAALRDLSPERRVFTERQWILEDGVTPKMRLGIVMRIMNGNAYAVTFRLVNAELVYGDRLTKNVVVDGLDDGVSALWHGWLHVCIELEGSLGDEVRADFERGQLKPIDMRNLVIAVCDGQRHGRLNLPDGVALTRTETWKVDYPVFDFGQKDRR